LNQSVVADVVCVIIKHDVLMRQQVKVTIEGTNRLIRNETGADYSATSVAEVNGDDLTAVSIMHT